MAVLLPLLAFASSPSSSSGSSLSFTPCTDSTVFGCATLPVALDRGGTVPGTISLSVERRLSGAQPSAEAVVALAGGPGQAVLPLREDLATAIAPALRGRDLLLFDQRGTGASGPLSCAALTAPGEASDGERVTNCTKELGPARGAYTTAESVEDIEALRQAAGYEKLVLYGTSYGTKVALDYAERYPQNVEALVLDSTETPGGPDPFHLSTFKAIVPALRELCLSHACAGSLSDPASDLARLGALLRKRSLHGYAIDPHNGKRVKLPIVYRDLYSLMLAGDLNPELRAAMPSAVHAALNHDPDPLVRLLAFTYLDVPSPEQSTAFDETLFLDTSCEETPFPWQRGANTATRTVEAEAALNKLPSSDFYPLDAEAALFDSIPTCEAWPDASPPPPAEQPLPNVPTLILSGGQDLRTPTENARQVAGLIPGATILTVPYTGHSVIGSDLSGCAKAALVSFFGGSAIIPCTKVVDRLPPVPLAPTSLSQIAPTRGLHGARGRTLAATLDTLRDLRRTIIELGFSGDALPIGVRFGGLRGGTAELTKTGAVLDRLSYIPGVQLSGRMSTNLLLKGRGSSAVIKISGSSAAAGNLQIGSRGRLKGLLSRERFALKVSASATTAQTSASQPSQDAGWLDAIDPFPLPGVAQLRNR